MAIRRLQPGDNNKCAPKSGEIICVRAKRLDRSEGHQHFGPDEMRKATKREKEIRAEARASEAKPARIRITFEARGVEWCETFRGRDRATPIAALKRAYAIRIKTGLFGEMELSEINATTLKALQAALLDKFAYNTVELTMHYVKAVMRSAVDDGLVERDPTVRLKMPARDPLDPDGVVTEKDVPTLDEAHAILETAPSAWRWAIYLGFGCGTRVGETIGVAPFQFHPLTGELELNAQEQRRGRVSPKSRRGVRTISLPEVVIVELKLAIRSSKNGDSVPLATGIRGGRPRRDEFYNHAWRPALKAAGLAEDAYNFHAARHFCASSMLARNVPITEVAFYLGDAVETISRVYAHWLRDSPSLAKRALDQTLAPRQQPHRLTAIEGQG